MLFFRRSRSLMIFKIGVLKNFAKFKISKTTVLALAGLLLQKTYDGCFWIFATANTFFQLNLVFIADSHTDFYSELRWKHNLRSSHWNSSTKKVFIRNFANFTGKHLCWSLLSIELQAFRPAALVKRDSDTDVFLWHLQHF